MDILQTFGGVASVPPHLGSQSRSYRIRLQQEMADYQDRMRERITQAREEKGYSPEELALRAGLSAKQIRRIEAGDSRNPHLSTVRAIAEATGKDVTWIRPDLEAEEAELQQQLDRLETKLDLILSALGLQDEASAGPSPALPKKPRPVPPLSPETSETARSAQARRRK